jgi:transposase
MATERLSMRKTREILRQKWAMGRTHREVATSLEVSAGAVGQVLGRAKRCGLSTVVELEALTDEALDKLLYGGQRAAATERPVPDWAHLHLERRRAGVTLELLHLEYLDKHPQGYQYTQFCELYRRWLSHRGLSMRQEHRAGDKLFVDYSGKRPHYIDAATGEPVDCELFVAVLGASNYTFAEATRTQRGPDFIASHVRALTFLGGVPRAIVPDQLKSGVTTPCRYEPGIQRTYQEMARHYGTTVLPARPLSPKDKAKVEVAVQIAQRWILARLRNEVFYCLSSLNRRIDELLEDLNDRVMRIYGTSRRDLFQRLDRPALLPLPSSPFVYSDWKRCRVNIDYHIELDHHYYSVPHALIHQEVEARYSATTVELLHHSLRVASHPRSYQRGGHSTVAEHMPKAHQKHREWSPSRIVSWAHTIGPHTAQLVAAILQERQHPEQGYRSCLGILRLGKRYGEARLEAACARALAVSARSYRHLESILKAGLDSQPLPQPAQQPCSAQPLVTHDNLRGPTYYN